MVCVKVWQPVWGVFLLLVEWSLGYAPAPSRPWLLTLSRMKQQSSVYRWRAAGWDANRVKTDVASSCMTVDSRTADVCECEWTLRFDFHCHWSSLVVNFPPISLATHSRQSQVTLPLSAQTAEKEAALHPQHLRSCCILVPPGSSAALSRFLFGMRHHSKLASCIGGRVAHTTESLFETLAMYEGPLGS